MKTISKRLQTLERLLAPRVENEEHWGSLASVRDEIVCHAERLSESYGAAIRAELDALGPAGLWRETVRSFLADHGFVQSGAESLAETMARALNIGTDELRLRIAQGQIGAALTERFREPSVATDND
jgi:hypothetical protein